jgi:hypothetical protein
LRSIQFAVIENPTREYIRQHRRRSAEHEQHQGTVLHGSEKRGAGQFAADWLEAGSEASWEDMSPSIMVRDCIRGAATDSEGR